MKPSVVAMSVRRASRTRVSCAACDLEAHALSAQVGLSEHAQLGVARHAVSLHLYLEAQLNGHRLLCLHGPAKLLAAGLPVADHIAAHRTIDSAADRVPLAYELHRHLLRSHRRLERHLPDLRTAGRGL